MKVFISLDAEGCSGITHFGEVTAPGNVAGREAMLRDLGIVIASLRRAGIEDIAVCDGHDDGDSLPLFGIDADIVIRGYGAPYSMMQGIELGYDAACFVGYHARAGEDGVMSHTYFPDTVSAVRFDGVPVGELTINALLAAAFRAEPLFVSGDQYVAAEASAFPQMARAIVKHSYCRSAAGCFAKSNAILAESVFLPFSRPFIKNTFVMPRHIEVEYMGGEILAYESEDYKETFIKMVADMRVMDAKLIHT